MANAYYKGAMLKEAEANYKKILIVDKKDDLYITALERLGDITYRKKSYFESLKYSAINLSARAETVVCSSFALLIILSSISVKF